MENIEIKICDEVFKFTSEILFKHMREIEPLTKKQALWELSELDFILEICYILCISENKGKIKETIDNLNIDWIKQFTKDFEKIGEILQEINDEDKKK